MVGSGQEDRVDYQTIRLATADNVVTVTLSRPDCGNAINVKMVDELRQAARAIEDEATARLVVLRGDGGAFSVGIDLRDFPADAKPNVEGFGKWEAVCRTFERLPCPTVAAIDGACAGGALMLALACDARAATDRATFALYEVPAGFIPGLGTFRLAKYIGFGRAKRMALTGRVVNAAEAESIGLVDYLCAPDALDATLAEAREEFRRAAPDALALTRRLLEESYAHEYEDFLGFFLAAQHKAIQSDVFKERVRQAHRANRPQGED
jgi:enoyl-CoA hydratase/carnithine racemase